MPKVGQSADWKYAKGNTRLNAAHDEKQDAITPMMQGLRTKICGDKDALVPAGLEADASGDRASMRCYAVSVVGCDRTWWMP